MTYFIKYTKTQAKKLIEQNYGATMLVLPSKANPNSPWFDSRSKIDTVEDLENIIDAVKRHMCGGELGNGVAFWVDESANPKKSVPKEKAIPCYRIQRKGEEGFMYCMVEEFAKYQNTSRKKIKKGVVYTPHDAWTDEKIASGVENNYYFWDGDFKGMKFVEDKNNVSEISLEHGIIEENRLVARLANGAYIRTSAIKEVRIENNSPIIVTQNSTYKINISNDSILYDTIIGMTVSK